jgi:hypothetical protein
VKSGLITLGDDFASGFGVVNGIGQQDAFSKGGKLKTITEGKL